MRKNQGLAKFVALRVRVLRTRFELSQERLAELSQLSRDAISRIERGNRYPRLATIEAIAEGLGITVAEFFASEEGPPAVTGEHQQRVARVDRHLRTVDAWLAKRIVEAVGVLCTPTPEERRKARAGRSTSPRQSRPTGEKRERRSRSPGSRRHR